MEEKEESLRIITFKDLWNIFLHRIPFMAAAALLSMVLVFLTVRISFTPKYVSTATLYILKQQNDTTSASNVESNFSLALDVVNDCTYLLKSHAVLDDVIEKLKLNISYDDLFDSISTSNPEETRILEVNVESTSPQQAKKIVDCLCEIGEKKIDAAMGFHQVNLYEYGTIDEKPSNRPGALVYLLIGVAAAVLVYSVSVIIFIFDDHIKDDKDINTYLGLTVLGDIPNSDENSKSNRRYYYKKKNYGYLKKRGD